MVRFFFAPKPKFNERFARQYRCEPPPEFPLTLPFSGMVHHLSAPDTYALTQTTLKITVGCRRTYPGIHFHCACRFDTRKLAHMLDSLVRVSIRFERDHVVINESQEYRRTTINGHCHLVNLAFERSPFLNPQMREHTLMVSATYEKRKNHNRTDSDRWQATTHTLT